MKIYEAVSKRIFELCDKNQISINKLAIMSGLTQSTLQSIIDGKSHNPTTLTIVRICDSLEISLKEFFDSELFDNIDIKKPA